MGSIQRESSGGPCGERFEQDFARLKPQTGATDVQSLNFLDLTLTDRSNGKSTGIPVDFRTTVFENLRAFVSWRFSKRLTSQPGKNMETETDVQLKKTWEDISNGESTRFPVDRFSPAQHHDVLWYKTRMRHRRDAITKTNSKCIAIAGSTCGS